MQRPRKRRSFLPLLLATFGFSAPTSYAATSARVEHVGAAVRGATLFVNVQLKGDWPSDVEERLAAGQEIAFEYLVQLRKRRRNFSDKTLFERYVVVTAKYNSLTRMYKLTRQVDGTAKPSELTDRETVMRLWMAELQDLALFDIGDFESPGAHYVRVKAKLQSRFKLLFVPADLETDWEESDRFETPLDAQPTKDRAAP